MQKRDVHIPYILVSVLIIAAILRFNQIDQPFTDAFSWRQSSTAMMAENFYRKNWNIFYPEVSWTGPEPGYQGRELQTVSYAAALLYIFVGQNDWVGRSIAVVFGLWGIFALYQLIRRVWDEERAIVSAAVMAVLPGSIFIERSFLPDPVMVSLVVTSLWMFVAYCQTERLPYLLLAGIIGTWGFLTKLPGLMIGIPMIYTMLAILGHKRLLQPRKIATLTIAAVLMLVPVIGYYLWARHLALSYPPYHFAGAGHWLWDYGLEKWPKENYFLPQLSQIFKNWMWSAPGIVLVLFGLFFSPNEKGSHPKVTAKQQDNNLNKASWLFHWWLLVGILYYLIGAKELVNNPWNFHIINPAASALVGNAIVSIASFKASVMRSPLSLAIIAMFLLIIGGIGQNNLHYLYQPYAQESYKLGLALRQVSQPSDLVVTMANDFGDPVAVYYSQRRGWVFPPAQAEQSWNQLPEDDHESIQLFEELRTQGADWLGIVGERRKDFWTGHPTLVQYVEHTCEFKLKTPEWVIYRILTPEEVAKRL
jgi:4-amino-4-deoxy-L-arabinose transferase-like glycosyltransferase